MLHGAWSAEPYGIAARAGSHGIGGPPCHMTCERKLHLRVRELGCVVRVVRSVELQVIFEGRAWCQVHTGGLRLSSPSLCWG